MEVLANDQEGLSEDSIEMKVRLLVKTSRRVGASLGENSLLVAVKSGKKKIMRVLYREGGISIQG
jgi:hypothetical protein